MSYFSSSEKRRRGKLRKACSAAIVVVLIDPHLKIDGDLYSGYRYTFQDGLGRALTFEGVVALACIAGSAVCRLATRSHAIIRIEQMSSVTQ